MHTCEPYGFTICYINLWLWRVVPLLQVIVGTVGNIINIAVLSRRRMRKFSTTVYLLGVAFADLGTLWTNTFPVTLNQAFAFPVRSQSTFLCKTIKFITYLVPGYSVWLIVLMTVERIVLTTSPVVARTTLSVKNAVVFAAVTLLAVTGFTAHLLAGYDVKMISTKFIYENQTSATNISYCMPVDHLFTFYTQLWPLMVIFVLVLIPFLVIAVGNGVILVTLCLQKRRLKKVHPAGNVTATKSYDKRKSSTKTLFLISALFIVTTLPYTIDQLISAHTISPDPYIQAQKELVSTLTFILITSNFTFNFVLYFVSGTMFKQEWQALLKDLNKRFGLKAPGVQASVTKATTLTTDTSTLQTYKATSSESRAENQKVSG